MKKTILVLAICYDGFYGAGGGCGPSVHDSDGTTSNYWVHYYHAYFYHTYYTPVFYRPVTWLRWSIRFTRITTGTTSSPVANESTASSSGTSMAPTPLPASGPLIFLAGSSNLGDGFPPFKCGGVL